MIEQPDWRALNEQVSAAWHQPELEVYLHALSQLWGAFWRWDVEGETKH